MALHRSPPAAFRATLAVIGVIALACLLMLLVLRPGLPVDAGADPAPRLTWLVGHQALWRFAWFTWMASALGLLLFCFLLRPFLPDTPLTRYALALVAIGVVPDLTAEFIFAFALPWLAERIAAGAPLIDQFFLFEYLAMLLTGALGNGAYNLGGLLLNLQGFRNPRLPRWLVWAGVPAWVLGLGLSAATAARSFAWMQWLTGASMALSLGWMLALALVVFRRPRRFLAR
jgi:hypothetical protein